MFWPHVCCFWALLRHGLSTKTLSQPKGPISPAATVILHPHLWRTKSQCTSVKAPTCRRSRWRINVRHTSMFWHQLLSCAVTEWMADNWPAWEMSYRSVLYVWRSFRQHAVNHASIKLYSPKVEFNTVTNQTRMWSHSMFSVANGTETAQ